MTSSEAVRDVADEVASWLPKCTPGEGSFAEVLCRLLASVPGGEELEDMGFAPFHGVGLHEFDLIARTMMAVQDKYDVETVVAAIVGPRDE